ncbi:MAG: AI-2E family transporter [Bacteroidetes bacterium HGW-Bacteroidetes-7]|jgi:predicted PurR-regulated permease PerM|nr:MAG: AI-2E family transporter [Bacteroidetes bacterium HGW-Bacteroidetes-7]
MNQLAKYIIGIAVALIIGFIAWYFSDIVIYIIISAVLSLIGKPLMDRLTAISIRNFSIPKSVAAAITLGVMFTIIISIFLFIAPLAGKLFTSINTIEIESLGVMIADPLKDLNNFIINTFPTLGMDFRIENIVIDEFQKIFTTSSVASFFASVTSLLFNTVIAVLVVSFITFFFLKEQNMFDNMVIALFPDRYEENVKRALSSVNRLLVRYFIGISLQTVCIVVLNTLGLYFIAGLDFSLAIVLASLTGILNIIPYVGPWIGAFFGVLFTLTIQTPEGVEVGGLIIKLIAVFLSTQIIDNFVLQPLIFSNSVKAHPLEIFIVLLIAASVAGVIGMLVAIPSYTVIRVFAREFFSHFKLVQKLTDKI